MAEKLKITVSKKDMASDVASCRTVSIREKLLRRFFGYNRKVTILIPGDRIAQVAVEQIPEGGAAS